MKRIVFCFDGTACTLSNDSPSNVVLTAASINRTDADGRSQIIYYDEGVGTAAYDQFVGGVFGWGLTANLREAYRFLIFNYDPGDEIYVFGFSRGAFSARSFVGLVRYVGPLRRLEAARIDEALLHYHKRKSSTDFYGPEIQNFRSSYSDVCVDESDEQWRRKNQKDYVENSVSLLRIKYLGVWDTVSALGAPEILPGSARLNINNKFHDPSIGSFIEYARHAVALDERRRLFPPVLFGDLGGLNLERGFASDHIDAPYQERFFPGDHGSVGGGGDVKGLSDSAFAWILNGAKRAGLELDTSESTRVHSVAPNPFVSLSNLTLPEPNLILKACYQIRKDRQGPSELWQLSPSVIRRWKARAEQLHEGKQYRPGSLKILEKALEEVALPKGFDGSEILAMHLVQKGDTLYKLAGHYYNDNTKYGKIFEANRDTIDDARDLYVGWLLRIPKLSGLKT